MLSYQSILGLARATSRAGHLRIAVTRKSHGPALAGFVVPAGPASRESGQRCASAIRRMGSTRRPRMRLAPSPLQVGRPARPSPRATRSGGRPAWHRTCSLSRSSDGRTPTWCGTWTASGSGTASLTPPPGSGQKARRRAPPPLPGRGHADCGSCALGIKSPISRPKRLIALRSGGCTARRRGWLGILAQNGARQEQRRAVTPCSARAGERAEVQWFEGQLLIRTKP